jgi:hypothetical protein
MDKPSKPQPRQFPKQFPRAANSLDSLIWLSLPEIDSEFNPTQQFKITFKSKRNRVRVATIFAGAPLSSTLVAIKKQDFIGRSLKIGVCY